jgi:hypothetical protein
MFDDNKFTAFIRESSSMKIDTSTISFSLKGLNPFGYMQESGAGNFNEDKTEINWVYDFEVPRIYEKWLTLEIQRIDNGISENGSIGFTLDRNKAMGHTVRQDINKNIKIDGTDVNINSITVSPMAAVVEGSFESKTLTDMPEPGKAYFVDFDLFVNGKAYFSSGGRSGGINSKREFSKEFNTVPININSLQIKNVKFVCEIHVDKMIEVTPETRDMKLDINETDISIKKVYTDDKTTYITVKSLKYDEDLNSRYDPQIALFISENQVPCADIPPGTIYEENGRKYIERTFRFNGRGGDMKVAIKAVYITRGSSETIDIPVK